MSFEYYNNMEKSDLFQLLKKLQDHVFHFKKLEIFQLPIPVCLENEYFLTKFHLNNKWLDDFPSLKTIEKVIENEKKLFYIPEPDYYYLYYHLLVAYKKFLNLDKEICDDETRLNYNDISDYLIRKNLNATKFFEVYLEKGENLNEADLVHATLKEFDEVTNYKFDENFSPRKMTSEPVPLSDSEIENEILHHILKKKKKILEMEEEDEEEDLFSGEKVQI